MHLPELDDVVWMKGVLMLNVRFDSEKALEAILYVASKAPIPDIYHVGKIQELLSVDLNDPHVRFNLLVSCSILALNDTDGFVK